MQVTESTVEQDRSRLKAGSEPLGEEVFIFPTTVAQRRFWMLDQVEPGNPALNVPLAVRLMGRLDRELLGRAVNEILCRHEILRTSFRTNKADLVQVIHAEKTIRLAWFDLTHHLESEREVQANLLMLEEGKRPFVLTEGPFLRGGLIKLRDDEHILLLTMHHIVCDGWSNGILIHEVAKIYTAIINGEELPELPLQYADYAQWQKDWLESPAALKQRQFWQSQLQGTLPFLNLPTDYPRKSGRSHNSAIHTLLLPRSLTEALKDLCNRENLTPFMVFFATYATLLYRYTGQRDIIVGSPAANRNQPALEELIGLFSNPLMLRLNFSGPLTLRSLLARVKELSLEVIEHQTYPFEKLLEEIQSDPHRQGLPMLQAYFIFQKAFMQPQQMPQVTLTPLRSTTPGTLFEWVLGVLERAEGIRLQLEYNTDLFDQSTIDRMLHHFQQLLETLVTDQDVRIDDLPILTPMEHQQLVLDWNETRLEIPRDRCVHELFEEQAQRTPDALAVQNDGKQISYLQLNRRANQFAHFFAERGGGPQKLVGLVMDEFSIEFPACFLGVLKAGACCVVLDPHSGDVDLERRLNNGSLDLIVLGSSLSPTLRLAEVLLVIKLEETARLIGEQPATAPATPVLAEQPACVLFTSGFSGSGKGSIISHRALLNSAWVARHELGLQSHDCVAFSLAEMLPALLAGAALTIPPGGGRFNPVNWWQWVRSQGMTVAALPTTWWHELVQSLPRGKAVPKTELRVLAIGGSPISPSALSVWQRATAGHVRLLDRYLLAEAAGAVAFSELPVTNLTSGRVSIVRPAPNSHICLLDDNLRPVAVGVPGNIYVGGSSLASGYWTGAESSVADFVADNVSGHAAGRLLKTGDTGRFLAGGGIELLGRIQDLQKTRGLRLELCEISSTLLQHPNIWDAVVIPLEISGEVKIVAYVVNPEDSPVGIGALRAFAAAQLPAYMVPAAFVTMPSLPLTPGGKIDRTALAALGENQFDQGNQFAAPITQTEVALAKIWCELLGVDQIGIHENFFRIGGHSLLAVRMVNGIRRQMAPEMPVRIPFQYPTIQELAKALLTQKFAERKPELIQLQAGNLGPEVFLIIDGDSVGLFKLSRFMDKELRLYASVVPLPEAALRASAKKQFSELPRMEDLAAYHVALIKSRQTTDPIVLVGHCFAGKLAFEVAQQLQAEGIRVGGVLMLDTWMTRPSLWLRKTAWLREHLGKSLRQGPYYLWSKFLQRISKKKSDLAARLELGIRKDFNVQMPGSIIARINRHAGLGYQLKPLASRGILFLSQDDWLTNAYRPLDDSLGTRTLFTGGLQVINVPGNHESVLNEPQLATLAERFNKCVGQFR
jgi:non-ribosomal peptide synthetase component F/thioesterase domain-containing protein